MPGPVPGIVFCG